MDAQTLIQAVVVGAILAIIPAFGIAALIVIRRRPAGTGYWQEFADSHGYQFLARPQPAVLVTSRPPEIMELLPILPVLDTPGLGVLRPYALEGTQNGHRLLMAEYNCAWGYSWSRPMGLYQAPPFIFGARLEIASTLPSIVVTSLSKSSLDSLNLALPKGWVVVGQWRGRSVWAAESKAVASFLAALEHITLPDTEETHRWTIFAQGHTLWLLTPLRPPLVDFTDGVGIIARSLSSF